MPYFICVDIDYVSGFDHEDFKEYFRGSVVQFIDYGTEFGNLEQFKHLGEVWTELGEFYKTPQLSGIITCYNQNFRLLLNPQKKQIIYQSAFEDLLTKLIAI